MTNSLIAVFNGTIQNTSVQLANARALHSFLEIKSGFDNWIKNRITDYGFQENEDYIIVTERTTGRPRKEYHITLDMGKELAMVERNEKGRQIRKYFIECERAVLQNSTENQPLALPPATFTFELDEKAISELVWLWYSHHEMNWLLGHLIKPLEAIGSRYAPQVYGNHTEYKRHLKASQPILKRMLTQLKADKPTEFEQLQHRLTA